MPPAHTKPALLNSWKEIASYLGRGVRTVQRWERMGLPVHRVGLGPRCPVLAYVRDIDLWVKTRPQANENSPIRHHLHEAIVQSRTLRSRMAILREDEKVLREELVDKVASMKSSSHTFCGDSVRIPARRSGGQ